LLFKPRILLEKEQVFLKLDLALAKPYSPIYLSFSPNPTILGVSLLEA